MDEVAVQEFWNTHPCGDHIVGGLRDGFAHDYERFFASYDHWRYRQERHILACLDGIDWRDQRVLEIGLGQGAESEQLIPSRREVVRLDLTAESVDRVHTRLTTRELPYEDLRQGSALDIPWPDGSFDIVFSHGVLHHVPDILTAQREIQRVLRPGGMLVAMLYARRSLNYQVSIRVLRRAAVAGAYPVRRRVSADSMLGQHLANAERMGLRNYLDLDTFVHHNTDGPLNPFARVYDLADVRRDFPDFDVVNSYQRYPHAPPLPVHRLPGASRWGWHLWVHMRARDPREDPRS